LNSKNIKETFFDEREKKRGKAGKSGEKREKAGKKRGKSGEKRGKAGKSGKNLI
jgi:hypothetical protein